MKRTFQSTLPQGEWPVWNTGRITQQTFQSTLPQGEWRKSGGKVSGYDNFNPHSHKGSDFTFCILLNTNFDISIHTPARGVTITCPSFPILAIYFNPHSRKGSDGFSMGSGTDVCKISIHTPARGVTEVQQIDKLFNLFQSTLPQGEWHFSDWPFDISIYFNPHSRKGSDLSSKGEGVEYLYFNPHSRKGSDRFTYY